MNPLFDFLKRVGMPGSGNSQPPPRGQEVGTFPGYQQAQARGGFNAPPEQVNIPALQNLFQSLISRFNPGQQQQPQPQTSSNPNVKGSYQDMKLTMVPNANLGSQLTGQAPTPPPQPTLAKQMASTVKGAFGRNPDILKKPLIHQVAPVIQSAAQEFGVPPELLFDIGYYEGGFYSKAKNESEEGIKAGIPKGLFQFRPGTWQEVARYARNPNSSLKNWLVNGQAPDIEDPVANARAAAYLIKVGQLGKWQASKSKWGQYYNEDELEPYYAQTLGYEKGKNFL